MSGTWRYIQPQIYLAVPSSRTLDPYPPAASLASDSWFNQALLLGLYVTSHVPSGLQAVCTFKAERIVHESNRPPFDTSLG